MNFALIVLRNQNYFFFRLTSVQTCYHLILPLHWIRVVCQGQWQRKNGQRLTSTDLRSKLQVFLVGTQQLMRRYVLKVIAFYRSHQSHYEQFGKLTGTIIVDGVQHPIDLDVMRDHTHGIRDWKLMHRYAFHNFTTDHGIRGVVGVVSQPSTFSMLELGYIYDIKGNLHPVQEVDFPLWQHGEGRESPRDYSFRFKANDDWHHIQVKVLDCTNVFIGKEWEARLEERFCRYLFDGVESWGVSEFHFNQQEEKVEL